MLVGCPPPGPDGTPRRPAAVRRGVYHRLVYSLPIARGHPHPLTTPAGLALGLACGALLLVRPARGGEGPLGVWALARDHAPGATALLVLTAFGAVVIWHGCAAACARASRFPRGAWVGLWLVAAAGSLAFTFGRHGGDTLGNLAAHVQLGGPPGTYLFVGGEFLGHLWFVPWTCSLMRRLRTEPLISI